MSLNKQFKLYKVKVEPTLGDKTDVVLYVLWGIEFELDGYTNKALIETLLNFDPNADFVPIEDLTKEQILEKAIAAQGGNQFVDQLEYHHRLQLESDKAKAELVDATLNFQLDDVTPPKT